MSLLATPLSSPWSRIPPLPFGCAQTGAASAKEAAFAVAEARAAAAAALEEARREKAESGVLMSAARKREKDLASKEAALQYVSSLHSRRGVWAQTSCACGHRL